MKIHYEGEFEVEQDKEKVFKSLIDIEKVGKAFPGVEKIEKLDEKTAQVRVKMGIGALRGVLNIKLSFTEINEGVSAKVNGRGSGAQSTVDFTLSFTLDHRDSTTKVAWIFDGNVGGLMGSIGGRVLDSVARRLINETIDNLKKILERE